MTMTPDDREFIDEGETLLTQEWLGSYEEEQTKMFLGLLLTKYEELVSGRVDVTDNKCDNRPKSIPEDQVDALSIIDKTLDSLETIRVDWGASDVVGLLQIVRERIVRGYVAPQEPSECLCYGADGVTEPKCPACSSKVAPSSDREKQVEMVRLELHRVMASQWAVIAAALKMDQGQYDSFLSDLARTALAAPVAVDEAKLAEFLTSPTHAPASTHSPADGTCSECPWPRFQLPPENLARELSEWLGGVER